MPFRKNLGGLKRSLVRWLWRELALEDARRRERVKAIIGSGATLSPEAAIENHSGSADRIQIGANSYISGRLQTYGPGARITIGEWCYVGVRTEIWAMKSITVGNRVLIGHDVNIHDGTAHSLDAGQRHAQFRHIIQKGHPQTWDDLPGITAEPIVLEDDVSINFGTTILKGVRIGAGSVIAPGSMVLQNVPSGVIYSSFQKPVMIPIKLFRR